MLRDFSISITAFTELNIHESTLYSKEDDRGAKVIFRSSWIVRLNYNFLGLKTAAPILILCGNLIIGLRIIYVYNC